MVKEIWATWRGEDLPEVGVAEEPEGHEVEGVVGPLVHPVDGAAAHQGRELWNRLYNEPDHIEGIEKKEVITGTVCFLSSNSC